MVRSALPENWILNEGTELESFGTLAEWVIPSSYAGSGTTETEVIDGVTFLKLSNDIAGGSIARKKVIDMNMIDKGNMYIDVYVHDITTLSEIRIWFSSTDNLTKLMQKSVGYALLKNGLNRIPINPQDWDFTNGELYTNTMISLAIRVIAGVGKLTSISLSNLRYGIKSKCVCMLEFDDNTSDQSLVFDFMDDLGLKGTLNVIPPSIDGINKLTTAQLDDRYAKGWANCNHSMDATDLTTLSQTQIEANLTLATEALIAKGWTRGAYHVSYPNGGYNSDVALAMASTGMLTGRSSEKYQCLMPSDLYQLNRKTLSASISLATAKTYVDYAEKYGLPLFLLFHTLVVAGASGGDWLVSDYQTLVNYIRAKKIPFLTRDEFYNGLTNPRYRSIPVSRVGI